MVKNDEIVTNNYLENPKGEMKIINCKQLINPLKEGKRFNRIAYVLIQPEFCLELALARLHKLSDHFIEIFRGLF